LSDEVWDPLEEESGKEKTLSLRVAVGERWDSLALMIIFCYIILRR
jgi:hypothetical protein